MAMNTDDAALCKRISEGKAISFSAMKAGLSDADKLSWYRNTRRQVQMLSGAAAEVDDYIDDTDVNADLNMNPNIAGAGAASTATRGRGKVNRHLAGQLAQAFDAEDKSPYMATVRANLNDYRRMMLGVMATAGVGAQKRADIALDALYAEGFNESIPNYKEQAMSYMSVAQDHYNDHCQATMPGAATAGSRQDWPAVRQKLPLPEWVTEEPAVMVALNASANIQAYGAIITTLADTKQQAKERTSGQRPIVAATKELDVDELKSRLKELEAKQAKGQPNKRAKDIKDAKCHACGQKGHLRGDPNCPKFVPREQFIAQQKAKGGPQVGNKRKNTPSKEGNGKRAKFNKGVMCTFFQQGRCTRGNKCRFSHDEFSNTREVITVGGKKFYLTPAE